VGNVVMKASRSEAARVAVRADESNVAGTPTQRPRKLSKRGRARCGTHRTGYNSRCSAAAWGDYGVGIGFNCWGRKKKGAPSGG